MHVIKPIEAAPGVYQIQALGAMVTVLVDQDGVVLVDTGMRGSAGVISAGLKRLGTSLQKVRLLVLTHSHPDHAGSLGSLAATTGAQVAVQREDARAVTEGPQAAPSPFRHPLVAWALKPALPFLYDSPVQVAYLLEDGDRLPMAQEVRVVHTPGHTRGSICLFLPSQKVLIVGDALQYRFRRLSPPALWVTRDTFQAADSLKRLLDLDFEVICFSHFPPLSEGARHALADLIQRLEGAPPWSRRRDVKGTSQEPFRRAGQ